MRMFLVKIHQNRSIFVKSVRPISVLFFGSDLFSKSCLKALRANQTNNNVSIVDKLEVVCLPDKRNKLPVKQYALNQNIPIYTWPDLPDKNFDIGVVVSFGKLLPNSVIKRYKYGLINVHGSILPRWRGASPFMQAILADDDETGISIMQIEPGHFDRGRILMCGEKVKILKDWTSEDLGMALEDDASSCLLKCLGNIEHYLQNSTEQDHSLATHAPKMNSEDSIIVWDLMSSEDVYRRYRAFGFRKDMILRTSFNGKLIRLQKMCRLGDKDIADIESSVKSGEEDVPGRIIFMKKSKTICIRCKSGYIGVKRLIFGKPITANDFYNGSIQPLLKNGQIVKFE